MKTKFYLSKALFILAFFIAAIHSRLIAQQEPTDWDPAKEKEVVAVEKLGPFLPHVDEVEIDLLGGNDSDAKQVSSVIDNYHILARKTVGGKDAEGIGELWRMLPRSPWQSMMCHNPQYALRFRNKGKIILETTICWHCHNYDFLLPDDHTRDGLVEWGFDSDSKAATILLDILRKLVPPPAAAAKK